MSDETRAVLADLLDQASKAVDIGDQANAFDLIGQAMAIIEPDKGSPSNDRVRVWQENDGWFHWSAFDSQGFEMMREGRYATEEAARRASREYPGLARTVRR